MEWYWIVLIVIAGVFLYAVGIGLTLGVWILANEWVAKDENSTLACIFFWWAILPFLGIGFLIKWLTYIISKTYPQL